MFARRINPFSDYRKVQMDNPSPNSDHTKERQKRITEMEKVIVPAISSRIKTLHAAEQSKFASNKRVISEFPFGSKVMIKNVSRNAKTEPRYEGPFTVNGITKGNSYVLTDKTGALLTRNIPPSHIKLISHDTLLPEDKSYEVLALLDHKGTPYTSDASYLVRWKGYSPEDDSWEPEENIISKSLIDTYLKRRGLTYKRPSTNNSKQPSKKHKRA